MRAACSVGRKVFSFAVWLALLVCVLLPCNCSEVVRVAFFESSHFLLGGSDDEVKSGYAYEILHEISNYTGWHYEYVYGDWASLYSLFEDGFIDVFPGLAYRSEREPYMSWSRNTIDYEYHSLFVRRGDVAFASRDLDAVNGARIGVVRNNNMTLEFLQWAQENALSPVCVYYDAIDDLILELEEGNIDGFVGSENNVDNTHAIETFARIAQTQSFIAVRKGAPEILAQLDSAMDNILSEDPDFFDDLKRKYYNTRTANALLSDAEQAWISDHGVLRIAYVDSYLPFSGSDAEGNVTGVVTDITQAILSALKVSEVLPVVFVGYDSYNEALLGLTSGQVDAMFPVMKSVWHAEQSGIIETEPLVYSAISAVYKGDFDSDKLSVIALNRNAVLQDVFVKENYPAAGVVLCDSMEECLAKVKSGVAGSTLYNGTRADGALKGEFESLSDISIGKTIGFSFGVDKGNTALYSLLRRGISLVDVEEFSHAMFGYVGSHGKLSMNDFLREYAAVILPVVFSVVLLVLILVLYLLGRAREAQQSTERLNFELQEKQREVVQALDAANRANRAKTTFLSNMSHDIRTPMNAIMGYTAIALKQEPKSGVRSCLEKIEESSELLLMLINDVLDISRIESGKARFTPSPVNVTRIVDEVLDVTQGFLVGRSLDFSVERLPLGCPFVLADPVRLREILINVLSNAVKYTPDGGSIVFRASNRPGCDENHVVVTYSVSDTGIGMSEEFQKVIFDEFMQENSGARTQYKGTGLGLSITKRYVEMMGGSISVSSKKDVGSTFTIDLPFEYCDPSLVESEVSDCGVGSVAGLRVLLAEDNDMNAEIATLLLEDRGLVVTRVCDGSEAVSAFESSEPGSFDLILMDVMMPNLNGYEATRRIRALEGRPDGQSIPIIAMTANAFAEDVQASVDAGMDAHIAKPLVIDEVIRTIARFV